MAFYLDYISSRALAVQDKNIVFRVTRAIKWIIQFHIDKSNVLKVRKIRCECLPSCVIISLPIAPF